MARSAFARLGLAAGAALTLVLAVDAQAQSPAAAPPPAAAPKPQLSFAQRMQFEGVGEVFVLPGGRIVYEYLPPYRERIGFGADDPRAAARLMVLDPGAAKPRPLFRPDPKLGYEVIGVSPSGGRLALRVTGMAGTPTAAVVDVATGRLAPLQYAPYGDFEDSAGIVWLSDDRLVYSTAPDDSDPVIVARLRPAAADAFRREWTAAFEGKRTTADLLQSRPDGAHPAAKPGRLIIADARTGRGNPVAEGLLLNLRPSADGRFVASIRRNRIPPTAEINPRPMMAGRDLVVAGLGGPAAGKTVLPCPNCDVLAESVVWDPARNTLYFYARKPGQSWTQGSYYRYAAGAEQAETIDLHGQKPAGWVHFYSAAAGEDAKPYAPVPMNGGIAIPVADEASAPVATGMNAPRAPARIKWVQLRADGVRTISGSLVSASATPLAFTPDALFVLADGKVWRLSADAPPVNLTPAAQMVIMAQPLRTSGTAPLLAPNMRGGDVAGTTGKAGSALLQVMAGANREVATLDLDTNAYTPLGALPGMMDRVVAASASGVAVMIHADGNGIALSRLGGQAPFLRLNGFLANVGWPRSQQVKYQVDGHDLQACVMTNPAVQDHSKTPIVAYLYPGVQGRCENPGPAPAPSFTAAMGIPEIYSPEFLANLGYTVVVPAAPQDLLSTKDEALVGFSKLVDAAVDAAGKEGLGDASRVGLYGISQGGFSVLKTVTESGRYKAAVAGWSATDYASDYASFGPVRGMLQTIWSEGRRYWYPNNGLAAHSVPWEDPQWFIRSSSYFNSARITTPLLMAQSDLDANFPMNQFDELFTSLYIQRKDVDYVRYWGEGHGLASPANMEDFARRVKAFYAEKLGVPPQ